MSGESAPADNGGAVESLAEIMGYLAEYDPDGEYTTAAARYKALGVLERANQSAARPQPKEPQAETNGELPDIKAEGGANTLDECLGLLEIARHGKSGISLDWVEVGIIIRALASRPAPRPRHD